MATTTTRFASKSLDSFADPLFIRRTSLTRFSGVLRSEAIGQFTLSCIKPDAFDPTLREPPLGRENCSLSISLGAQHSPSSRRSRRLT